MDFNYLWIISEMSDEGHSDQEEHSDSKFYYSELKRKKRQRGTLVAVVGILTKLKQAEIPYMKS